MSTMDATEKGKNLILGLFHAYPFERAEMFLGSLARIHFTGKVMLLVHGISAETAERLTTTTLDVDLVPFRFVAFQQRLMARLSRDLSTRWIQAVPTAALRRRILRAACSLVTLRFLLYQDILSRFRCEKVLLTDVTDVYFQADPFAYVTSDEVQFFLEDHELSKIGNDRDINIRWLKNVYGEARAEALRGRVSSCAGTILGSADAMRRYLDVFEEQLRKGRGLSGWGDDQAIHNFILYSGLLPDSRAVANGFGAVLTMFNLVPGDLCSDNDGNFVGPQGEPIPVLHHYDRFPEVVAAKRKELEFCRARAARGAAETSTGSEARML
jgi:hypothetical protein